MSPVDQAARAARTGQELVQASQDVIARRLEILAAAVREPGKADLRELSLMGSEKVEALTASASAGLSGAMAVASSAGAIAAREHDTARKALDTMMTAKSPLEAAAAQTAWMTGAWTRAMTDGWRLGGAVLKAQSDALAPLHEAATANARRLKR